MDILDLKENRSVGELAVDEKTNEVSAIPELLDMIDIAGDVVSSDAMGCQKNIAKKILEKRADYVLALKGNQTSLHEDVKLYFENLHKINDYETLKKGHGRIEKREYFLEKDIDWLEQSQDWKGLQAIGAVRSHVEEKGTLREETRYFITSLTDAKAFAAAVRGHWSIENQLHFPFCFEAFDRRTLKCSQKMLKAARDPSFLARLLFEM